MTRSGRRGRVNAASMWCSPFGRVRRQRVAGSLGLAVTFALMVGTALVVLDPSPPPAAAATCGPAPQGRVAVVVVVDHGGGSAPSSRCVVVDQGATGLDALRAAGHQVRLDGGFVCAVDARPATGCGNVPGNPYWRYWHAAPGGAWDYSQVGAGGYRLPTRCAVEGWSWSDSTTARTPPRVAAPTPTCEAPPPPPPPPTASPGPPAATAPVVPASPGAPATPADAPGGVDPGSRPTGSAGSGPAGADGAVDATADAVDGDAVGGGSADADGSGGGDGEPADSGPDSPDPQPADRAADGGSGEVDGEFAAARAGGGTDGGSTPWGVLIAVVLVAVLAGASIMRTRARRHDPSAPSG